MATLMDLNLPAHFLLYAEDFDAAPSAPEARIADAENIAPELAEPSFSLAELEAARAEGFADGVAAEGAHIGPGIVSDSGVGVCDQRGFVRRTGGRVDRRATGGAQVLHGRLPSSAGRRRSSA